MSSSEDQSNLSQMRIDSRKLSATTSFGEGIAALTNGGGGVQLTDPLKPLRGDVKVSHSANPPTLSQLAPSCKVAYFFLRLQSNACNFGCAHSEREHMHPITQIQLRVVCLSP